SSTFFGFQSQLTRDYLTFPLCWMRKAAIALFLS
ncbi:MAG: hypothetical protein ACI9LF_001562, partial [Flavobacteriales bacterium]